MTASPHDVPPPPLVVDLDGTLIRSDMLYETFWSAMASRWTTPFVALSALLRGRAALKRRLAQIGPVDVRALPYNPDVLRYINDRRTEGVQTALVTASDQQLANRIAEHLQVFDLVQGSGDGVNLKGDHKARFLSARFPAGFAYMGDSLADLRVWPHAVKAVTVTPSSALRARVEKLGCEVEHLETTKVPASAYLRAIRPQDWLLNLAVFLPLLGTAGVAVAQFAAALVVFVALGLVTSASAVARPLLWRQAGGMEPEIPITHGTLLWFLLNLTGLALAATAGPWLAGISLALAAAGYLIVRSPVLLAAVRVGLALAAGASLF